MKIASDLHWARAYENSRQPLMKFVCVQIKWFLFCLSTRLFLLRPIHTSCTIYFPCPQKSTITPTYLHTCSYCAAFRLGDVWGWVYSHCLRDHPNFLPDVRSLRMSTNYFVLRPSVSLLLRPDCSSANPSTRLLNYSHIRWSSSYWCNFCPRILTCSGQGSICILLLSELVGIRVIGRSRGCSYLWNGNLCTLLCQLLPLGTWWCPCSSHRKTPLIFPSP